MKSELSTNFLSEFSKLPEHIKKTARKNYKLWKENQRHPSLEFKEIDSREKMWSIRVGIGWRALGKMNGQEKIIWFWIGSHSSYDKLIKGI